MLRERLHINLFMKKEIPERRWVEPKFRVKLLKVASVILSFFSANLFYGHGLEAESRGRKIQNYVKKESVLQARKKKGRTFAKTDEGRKIQNYVKKESVLQARKKKGRTFAKTEKGRKIRHYIKKRSFIQSNRGKMKARLKKIKDSGVIAYEMSKKNRWFLKKPVQISYSKTSSDKHYVPRKPIPEETKKVGREALQMAKNLASAGPVIKPDVLYPDDPGREALQMAKTRASIVKSVDKPDALYPDDPGREALQMAKTRASIVKSVDKPDALYPDDPGREALQITKTRARKTGLVKPDDLYSRSVSNEARGMTYKWSRTRASSMRTRKQVSAGGNVFTAKILKSMSKRPVTNYAPFNDEIAGAKKNTDAEKSIDSSSP